MAVLIESRKSDGTLIGRCDARCYNAQGVDCDCICGGLNHGKGLDRACIDAEDRWSPIVKKLEREEGVKVSILPSPVQMELF